MTALHKYIQKHAEEAGYPRLSTVTKPYIQKFLKEQDMKPFKIKYYCEKRDSDFESKMHEVLLVYKQIEMQFDENGDLIVPDDYKLTITVSYDEMQNTNVWERSLYWLALIYSLEKQFR